MKLIKLVVRMALAAQLGTILGAAVNPNEQQSGIALGPLRIVPTNVLPALGIGLASGGSSLFSLLSGFVLAALIGDRFERE